MNTDLEALYEKIPFRIIRGSEKNGWKNKKNTGGRKCSCETWENHWNNFGDGEHKFEEQTCSNEQCPNKNDKEKYKAKHGAHIFHSSVNDSKEWIVPFCVGCNVTDNLPETDDKLFDLKEGTILVNANKGVTCEYVNK
jgi:hypothetical protein